MMKMHSSDDVVEVPDADDMDDETFLLHLEKRHGTEVHLPVPAESAMKNRAVEAWIGSYRSFHDRLHSLAVPGQYDHEHELEEPE